MNIPLLFLHAFPLDARMWEPQLRECRERGRAALTFEVPGFGESRAASQNFAASFIDNWVDPLLAQLDAAGVRECIPVGLSMGGYLALALLECAPERVRALVLCDTRSDADDDEGKRQRARTRALLEKSGAAGLARENVNALLGQTTRRTDAALSARVESWIAEANPAAIAGAMLALSARPDRTAMLKQHLNRAGAAPLDLLVICGEEDGENFKRAAVQMAQLSERVELKWIADAGHLSALERPAIFAQHMHEFLAARNL